MKKLIIFETKTCDGLLQISGLNGCVYEIFEAEWMESIVEVENGDGGPEMNPPL